LVYQSVAIPTRIVLHIRTTIKAMTPVVLDMVAEFEAV
jgi:hypothetical protein